MTHPTANKTLSHASMAFRALSLYGAAMLAFSAHAQPVTLSDDSLDRVTAGSVAFADAGAQALGDATVTFAQTQTLASPTRANGKAKANATGQFQVVSGSLVGLSGAELDALISAAAAAPEGGATFTAVSGMLKTNRKFEVVVLRARATAIGVDADASTSALIGSLPDGSTVRVRWRERDTRWGEVSRLVITIRAPIGG